MAENKLTPGAMVKALRDNQNSNKTLRAQFSNHFFSKFSYEELVGLQNSIDAVILDRSKSMISEEIQFLKEHGYKVS